MSDGLILLCTGALLVAGLAMSTLAARVRVPGLVLILGLGMLIGSDGLGWVPFDNYELARRLGIIALAIIVFEGGIAAGWREIAPVIGPALSLALLGTLLTALISGLVARLLFHLGWTESMLLGAIVSSTDGAAIFAVLRGSPLRRRLARTLEGEAGLNDPVAVVLVLGFIAWATHPGYGVGNMVLLFLRQLSIGGGVGILVGAGAVLGLRRLSLPTEGLYPVFTVACAAVAYGGADVLSGSGFLAVYLTGLAIGALPAEERRNIAAFHDGLAWLAQMGLFLGLGLLVFPSQLGHVALKGTVLALTVALLARPAATLIATIGWRFSLAERVTLGWAGLRGAVPVVLATFPVIAGVPKSHEFFNIIFFAVLVSTVLQGTSFEALARRLGVTQAPEEPAPSPSG